jgi:UPF0755 protein
MKNLVLRAQWYIVVLLASIAVLVWFFVWQSSPISNDASKVRLSVPRGWTSRDVAYALREKGLIRNAFVFRVTARIGGQAVKLKPGAYDLSRNMSIFQIIKKIASGDVAAVWVTIPEGYTIRQIGSVLQQQGIVYADEFVSYAYTKGLAYSRIVPIPSSGMEGYLFPDTYLLSPSSTPDKVVQEMLYTFRKKVIGGLGNEVSHLNIPATVVPPANARAASKTDSAWYTVLTVASMIEREARVPKDRSLISAVIWNRLRMGMKLEIDATVLYNLGHHKSRMTYADLRIPGPYNTYYVSGLPAGPIANPGFDSVKAALSPANVNYLFYVAKKDGSHIFSRTLSEHNSAKIRARSGR